VWKTAHEVVYQQRRNMPRRDGISDAISCEIHSKKVCWAWNSSIHHDGSHETWFKGRYFHPLHVNELSDADMNAWKDTCRALLAAFCSQRARGTVLFTDECAIYWSVHSPNIVFWAKENPHFYEELERNPPHVMVWAGLSATHVWLFLLSRLHCWTGLPWHA
jgi:hypothetical protein